MQEKEKSDSFPCQAPKTESTQDSLVLSEGRKRSPILDPLSQQQPAQAKQQQAGLVPDQRPKQAGGLVAMDFSERLARGKVQQIHELRIVLLPKMVERAADHPMRAEFAAQRRELRGGA